MDGIGLLLASMIMALYFQRLAVHHLPAREVIQLHSTLALRMILICC